MVQRFVREMASEQRSRRDTCTIPLRIAFRAFFVLGLNGVAVARHGPKFQENGATACKILTDIFWDLNIFHF